VVLAIGVLAGMPCSLSAVFTLVGELAVVAFGITALGLLVAVRIRAMQAFMTIVQMLVMPLFFLSGALYPLADLPRWLSVLTLANPLTYAVDLLRRTLLEAADPVVVPLSPGVAWAGWAVPGSLELGLVAVCSLVALGFAARTFGRE
jgi:ABC-2 type transport system permease protein